MRCNTYRAFLVALFTFSVRPAPAQPGSPTAAFEVASVKPTPKDRQYVFKRSCEGDRFVTAGMPLALVIRWSYELPANRIIGLPDWTSDRESAYDIEGRASAPISEPQCREMVRSLLMNRFSLATHREQREMRAFALTVAKKGAKLRDVTPGGTNGVRINGAPFRAVSDPAPPAGLSMTRFAAYLGDLPAVGAPVIDRTGLAGVYSFSLMFALRQDDLEPSIWAALEEQLGLKLEATKAQLEVLVVDHLEKASENH